MANSIQRRGSVRRMRLWASGFALVLMVILLPLVVSAQSQGSWTFTTLYKFKHPRRDGAVPSGGVIKDKSGNLFGPTYNGGASGHWGAVFKLDPSGTETVLHSFYQGRNGYHPTGTLIQDGLGNLYGTTVGDYSYYGTVFKLDANGKQTVLYRFTGGSDGGEPHDLLRDAAGNFYGTTYTGGASDWGTVFKLDKHGKETVLNSFSDGADGGSPAGLVTDSVGNLYGATSSGGDSKCNCGTVFKLDSTGKLIVLHTFTGGTDGSFPSVSFWDASGNLYGNTYGGGDLKCEPPSGCGTVFRMDSTGKLTVLYTVKRVTDGTGPFASFRDSRGSLYGTTGRGGDLNCNPPYGCGTVFAVDKAGKETVLHEFSGGADGASPNGLFRDADGNLYGTTSSGGDPSCPYVESAPGCGTVFKLQP